MFLQIHHIAIICSDYNKSKYFYNTILGLPIIEETYRASSDSFKLDLKINDITQLELFYFKNSPPRQSYPEACGLRHIAFSVKNINDVISYLQQNNINCEPIRTDHITQKKFTFFQDPDKLPIEIYET
jgi:glyoxylase I family protein